MRQKRTMQNVGPSATKLINEESKLESDYTVFRFWDNESQPEYIIAIKPMLNSKNDSLISDSLFTNNIVSSYDSSGDPSNRSKKLKPLSPKPIEATSIFRLNSSKSKSAYYNIDVIDPSQPNMILPAQLGLSPRVKQTTGQHKIDFPSSLSPSQKSFTISDIIVGKSQEMKQDNRIPIVPTFNRSFKQDEKMLLFFETYNLPKGGYKFEYYFERKRTIFRDKKVEEKPSVTILRDKVDGRDQQLFSINLSDLKPSKYNLVFTFSALSGNTGSVQTKRIELEVTD